MSLPARPQAAAVYVFDASSLINLEKDSRNLSVLNDLVGRMFIPRKIAKEVDDPRSALGRWLSRNDRCVTQLLTEEHELYYQFITQTNLRIHDGEATALAVAVNRVATLVVDDNTARKKAESHGVLCLTADQFLGQLLI